MRLRSAEQLTRSVTKHGVPEQAAGTGNACCVMMIAGSRVVCACVDFVASTTLLASAERLNCMSTYVEYGRVASRTQRG